MISEFERVRTANHDNLTSVNITKDIKNDSQNINIGPVNAGSVINKDIRLKQELVEEGVDIVVVEGKHMTTFQSVKWKLTMKNSHLNIVGVYRLLPWTSNVKTINQFTDEFLENLQD